MNQTQTAAVAAATPASKAWYEISCDAAYTMTVYGTKADVLAYCAQLNQRFPASRYTHHCYQTSEPCHDGLLIYSSPFCKCDGTPHTTSAAAQGNIGWWLLCVEGGLLRYRFGTRDEAIALCIHLHA